MCSPFLEQDVLVKRESPDSNKVAFLAHLSRTLKWAIVIARRPSVVRRKLSHCRHLFWNRWTEFNETWQEARSQRPLLSLWGFFYVDRKNKITTLASDWLVQCRLLWNRWKEFYVTWQEARSRRPLQIWVFRTHYKNKMTALASDWLVHFEFFSETAERNSTKLDRKQDLNVLYQFCVFRADR